MGRQLAKAGRTIEKLYGGPQDIEWTVHRHQVYFVQTRPMTTHPVEQSWEDRQIWTNLNTGEVFPDIVTPLDWSILSALLKVFFQDLFWILGIEIQNHPLVGVVAGRVYFNVNTGMAFFVNLPSRLIVSRKKASMLFGGGDEKQYDLRKISFGPDDLPDLKVSVWKILRRMPRSLYLLYTRRTSKAFKVLEHLKRNNRHYGSVSYDTMTMPQLAVLLNEILDRSFSKLDALYLHGLASNFIVYILCAKWLGDKNGILANSLLKAAGGMDDVQAGAALVELAQWARRDNSVCDIICFGEHWEDIRPQLIQSDPGRQFFEHWESFMNQHGHHCRSEMLLYNPRWCERPDYVLDMVRACLSKPEQDTPGRRYKQQLHAQNERAEKILNRLRNPIKRWILRKQVKRALDGLAFRENAKSEVVRMLSRVRKMLLRLGQLMSENGILADPEDIFFLAWAELVSIVNGRTDFEVRGTVQQRRGEFERYQAIEPPQVIVGKFDPDSFVPQAVDTSVSVFSGMSACPGKATGKARVILRSDEDQQVLPGEILIAPFTDPGWTPYFVNAAGIVMDQGGLLSHGSVVAREFGIPAVVNVGPATKIIRTGQTVEVNADQGIVRILS